ncbi:MAG: hypothetical protein ACI4RP_03575 [Acutalibacteraceae bacterium]
MLEQMNALDRLSRAKTPHPSATLTPSPEVKPYIYKKTAGATEHYASLHPIILDL